MTFHDFLMTFHLMIVFDFIVSFLYDDMPTFLQLAFAVGVECKLGNRKVAGLMHVQEITLRCS